MIQLKYASPRIGAMTETDVQQWGMALLLKIHVITGWVIPQGNLLNILTDQFQKKLVEDYSTLNTDEIEYAFRRSGTTIQDWGKSMNLNLVDQVLLPYLSKRSDVNVFEEKARYKPPEQVIYTDEQILNMRRGEIETTYQALRKGYFPLIHDYYQEVLQEDGHLQEGENITEFLVRSLNGGIENLYQKEEEEKTSDGKF